MCDFWSRSEYNVLLEKRSLNLFNENYVIDDWILPGENVFKVITWDSRQINFFGGDR
jgi:hypothetical protein